MFLSVLEFTVQGTKSETVLDHYFDTVLYGESIWGVENVYNNKYRNLYVFLRPCHTIQRVLLKR